MSEQAPERTARPGQPARPGAKPKGRENVFTRKIGPLPMWVWLAIVAAVIVLWALWSAHKSSSASSGKGSGGGKGGGGYGRSLVPPVVIRRTIRRRARPAARGHEDDDDERRRRDPDDRSTFKSTPDRRRRDTDDRDRDEEADEREHGAAHPMVRERTRVRGRAAPGDLVHFQTNSRGNTPSLQEVADGLNTTPDAIIQESTGRGIPHGPQWTRYVQRGEYDKPLPNGVQMAILARQG